jgi:hypothetical protein
MAGCNAIYFLLCYVRFSPIPLEITNFFLSIIVGITTFIGHQKIPFYIDSQIYKIIYFFNVPYLIIIVILNIIFLFFRFYELMNNSLNLWGYGLSVVEIYVALFGILTNLINDSLIISNMKYYQEMSLKRKSQKYPLITQEQLFYTKIILLIILFIWVNIILIALMDNFLINMKISASYHTYELAMREEEDYARSQRDNDDNNHNEVVMNTNSQNIIINNTNMSNNSNNNNQNNDINNNNHSNDLNNQNNIINDNINNQNNNINVNSNNNANIQDNNPINVINNQNNDVYIRDAINRININYIDSNDIRSSVNTLLDDHH